MKCLFLFAFLFIVFVKAHFLYNEDENNYPKPENILLLYPPKLRTQKTSEEINDEINQQISKYFLEQKHQSDSYYENKSKQYQHKIINPPIIYDNIESKKDNSK